MRARLTVVLACVALLLTSLVGVAGAAGEAPPGRPASAKGLVLPPKQDPFYRYTGSKPLSEIAPGTVLNTRSVLVHVETIPVPVQTVQLLFRTTDEVGAPSVTATSVLRPLGKSSSSKLFSYQSFYDTLTPNCEPSYALAGGFDPGFLSGLENPAMLAVLSQGYTVSTTDYEGQDAHYVAGHESGKATLDGIRAAVNSPATGLTSDTKVGMLGYSGGAIANEWATELAPSYAPDVNRRLVGSSSGGVLVDPIHNLKYVDGSPVWGGITPMAILGVSRANHIDLQPYLSSYGKSVFARLQNTCLVEGLLPSLGGMKFAQLFKPEYADPTQIPGFKDILNKLTMGTGGTPTTPMMLRTGANGGLDGTFNNNLPGIGPGDGVMVAGDLRSLARQYCAKGVDVDYHEYKALEHVTAGVAWIADSLPWLMKRFAGAPATNTCSSIAPGNSITPSG